MMFIAHEQYKDTYLTSVDKKKAKEFVAIPKRKNVMKTAKKFELMKKSKWKMAPDAISARVDKPMNALTRIKGEFRKSLSLLTWHITSPGLANSIPFLYLPLPLTSLAHISD